MAWNWKTYDKKKVDLTTAVMPDPSAMGISHGKLCLYQGTYPNPRCPMHKLDATNLAPKKDLATMEVSADGHATALQQDEHSEH